MNFKDVSISPSETLVLGWKNMFLVLWREIFTLLKANLCFLLWCLPVVTIPVAVTALHGICVDAIRGKDCRVMRTFWDTCKHQFFSSLCAAVCFASLEFISLYGAWFYFSRGSFAFVFGLFLSAVAVVGWLMMPYCFCMLARVDLTFVQVLKNAFLLAFLNLKFSICSGVLTLTLAAAMVVFWLRLVPLILLCGFSLSVYIASYFSLYGLQRFVLTEEL